MRPRLAAREAEHGAELLFGLFQEALLQETLPEAKARPGAAAAALRRPLQGRNGLGRLRALEEDKPTEVRPMGIAGIAPFGLGVAAQRLRGELASVQSPAQQTPGLARARVSADLRARLADGFGRLGIKPGHVDFRRL